MRVEFTDGEARVLRALLVEMLGRGMHLSGGTYARQEELRAAKARLEAPMEDEDARRGER